MEVGSRGLPPMGSISVQGEVVFGQKLNGESVEVGFINDEIFIIYNIIERIAK